jgi:hypothetical protein
MTLECRLHSFGSMVPNMDSLAITLTCCTEAPEDSTASLRESMCGRLVILPQQIPNSLIDCTGSTQPDMRRHRISTSMQGFDDQMRSSRVKIVFGYPFCRRHTDR